MLSCISANKISLNCLSLLDEPMIKELFPLIGDRAIFIKNMENYKKMTQKEDQLLDDDTFDDMQVSACLVRSTTCLV